MNNNLNNTIFSLEEIIEVEKKLNEKNNKKKPSSNKKGKVVYIVLITMILIMSCLVTVKAVMLKEKIDNYENNIVTITKEDKEIKVYSNSNIDTSNRSSAMEEYVSCLNSSIDSNNLPDSINSIIKDINNYYNENDNYFAYVYKDLYTGFTVTYNGNQSIFTASAVKAPTDIYIYEKASMGEIDLDEELTYTSNYYSNGSGVLKEKSLDTKYDIRTLLKYSTVTSDNAAHNMLTDRFGRENMYNFWKEKGTTALFSQNSNWGVFTASDCQIYMEELYNFYISNEEYGTELMKNFIDSYPKFITNTNNYQIASKSGWSGSTIHDVALVLADNPYIVVALSNTGDTGEYVNYFNKVSTLSEKLHNAYWEYKINACDNLKKY